MARSSRMTIPFRSTSRCGAGATKMCLMRIPVTSGNSRGADGEPSEASRFPRSFVLRAFSAGLSIGILAATPLMWAATAAALVPLGGDFHGYQTAVDRFLQTGSPYAPWQLSGPYGFADAG